jgi:hypothetical protein
VFYEDFTYKKKNSYSAERFIISDDIEEEIIVLSGNWRFSSKLGRYNIIWFLFNFIYISDNL